MKNLNLLFFILLFSTYGYSQKIKTNFEILQIMNDSKLAYEINTIDKPIECKDYSDKLNFHDSYRVSTDSGIYTYKYDVNEKAKPYFGKAEFFFELEELDSALYFYKLAVEQDSSLFNVLTYIGQIYEIKKDYDTAIQYYKMAIEKNYIDFMAHWFLADIYASTNKINDAVDEITIARILNRNNPRIRNAMVDIFNKANRDTLDWYFNPQIELNRISENKLFVGISEKWVGYAMAKALWLFEPGYRESMGVAEGEYSIIEDKECLIALLVAHENAKIQVTNDTQLSILKEAAENKQLEEYIFYEIVLPQNPFIAYRMPEKLILVIKDYILNIRNPKR